MTNEANKNQSYFETQRVLFYGRTLEEYIKMFNLDLSKLKGKKILDCPAGPASFIAEATALGLDVVGCDPLYTDDLATMNLSGTQDVEITATMFGSDSDLFSRKFYNSEEALKKFGSSALAKFLEDYSQGKQENRYLKAELPNLPFADKTFDLVLSSNLLFVYSNLNAKFGQIDDKLESMGYEFHRDAIRELLRVTKGEVRIYPIGTQALHQYAEMVREELEEEGIKFNLVSVEYEMVKDANLMLRLKAPTV